VARYTKTKRPEKKIGVEQDIQQAEHIQSSLETLFEKLVQYKWLALGGLAALLVVIVAITVIAARVESSAATVGADLDKVLVAQKAIDAAADAEARKAAVDKALVEVEPLLGKYVGEPAGRALLLLKASALIQGARAAEALPILEQLKADPEADVLALPVLFSTVQGLKAKGDLEGGVKALEGAGAIDDVLARLALAKLLGDLYNPFIGDAKSAVKDREKALHHYNEALALLKDRAVGKAGSTEEFFQNELKKRIAFLKG
jgi:tetratricopeptide (TPR) repeat protein